RAAGGPDGSAGSSSGAATMPGGASPRSGTAVSAPAPPPAGSRGSGGDDMSIGSVCARGLGGGSGGGADGGLGAGASPNEMTAGALLKVKNSGTCGFAAGAGRGGGRGGAFGARSASVTADGSASG